MTAENAGNLLKEFSRKRSYLFTAAGLGLLASTVPLTVAAQILVSTDSDAGLPPPTKPVVDVNNVDLISGRYQHPQIPLSIGSKNNGLVGNFSWGTQDYGGKIAWVKFYSGDNMEDYTQVTLGGITDLFYAMPGSLTYRPKTPNGQSLQFIPDSTSGSVTSPGTYIYTMKDGTQATYKTSYANAKAGSNAEVASNSKINRPNGEQITVNYGYDSTASWWSMTSAVSSNGWMIKYNYIADPIINSLNPSQKLISQVVGLNLSAEPNYCDPTAFSCTFQNAWPTISYTYDSSATNCGSNCFSYITKVSDALGDGVSQSFLPVPASQPYDTATFGIALTFPSGRVVKRYYDSVYRTTSVSFGGKTWTYTYSDTPTQRKSISSPDAATETTTVTDPSGDSRNVRAHLVDAIVFSVIDELKLQTSYQYDSTTNLNTSATLPEGNSTTYGYDSRGNLTSVHHVAKAGSGIADVVMSATYSSSCDTTNSFYCNKPLSITDARGNETDYTYDPAHGGILTESGPADADGVRPQKRYSYKQLYPKIRDSNGNLVNSTPIWQLVSVSTCKTATAANSASCVGTAAETVTSYAYNSNNLLLTSQTVAAGDGSASATTSYTYDNVGNVVSVKGPRTDVDDTHYTTYDIVRRPVYEIEALPGGPGSPHRTVVHHLYDSDGHETQTETGYASSDATDGSDFVVTSFKRMTFDSSTGLLTKTEVVQP